MTQTVDMVGNTLHVDAIVAEDGIGSTVVGSAVTSAGGNITIAADDTIAEALQEIADIADPQV